MNAPASTAEIGVAGRRLYDSWCAREFSPELKDRFIVFDVPSGEYEIADTDIEATKGLWERHPAGLFWGTRIGGVAYRLRSPRRCGPIVAPT
jgi:hypothetical protein